MIGKNESLVEEKSVAFPKDSVLATGSSSRSATREDDTSESAEKSIPLSPIWNIVSEEADDEENSAPVVCTM